MNTTTPTTDPHDGPMSIIRMGKWKFMVSQLNFRSLYLKNVDDITFNVHLMGHYQWRILEDDLRRRKILGDLRAGCLQAVWPRFSSEFDEVKFIVHADGRLAYPLWELLGGSRSRERWELAGDLAEQHNHPVLAAFFRRWADLGTWDS